MKKIVIGIVAHVDAGKTTLSEGMLYLSGQIRQLGRVDHRNAFLDYDQQERNRGITIFSKEARLKWKNTEFIFIDTPGHADFSTEMERSLQVLDYAIMVVNGLDGIQNHTQTIWKLLDHYDIPTFLFVNKMDISSFSQVELLHHVQEHLHENCFDLTQLNEETYENIALIDDDIFNDYMENHVISNNTIAKLIQQRKLFPVCFGSALKLEGVEQFMDQIDQYSLDKTYSDDFGAIIYKMTHDENNHRLIHMKITGGSLNVKEKLGDEKVDQIRLYSGNKFETVQTVHAGDVCAIKGLKKCQVGERLGNEHSETFPLLSSYIHYRVVLPKDCDQHMMLKNLQQLSDEDPSLHVVYDRQMDEIRMQLMGEIQIEILKNIIQERFGVAVEFDHGEILYKETILDTVEGVGHYEPLRHYAEVHLLLDPLPTGQGLQFEIQCPEDVLNRHWQRLIMTHLQEREHLGVLTGSPITDIRITLLTGRAHQKHTEGGDFRQATYRAIRQGLRMAKSVLLEPYYQFELVIPKDCLSRALYDIENMHGTFQIHESDYDDVKILGEAPVVCMQNYHNEVISYSRGKGKISCTLKGYQPCHNQAEVIKKINYDCEADTDNPTGSIFCTHGAGFYVKWNEVRDYMHIQSNWSPNSSQLREESYHSSLSEDDELESIFIRTYGPIQRKTAQQLGYQKPLQQTLSIEKAKPQCLLVDGYNVIHAWDELRELAKDNLDGARFRLMDMMCNYQGYKKCLLILVFDAYKVKGNIGSFQTYHNIHVVYTKEAQTADMYIERVTHDMADQYAITVATSDALEQLIVTGAGAYRMSSRELKRDLEYVNKHKQQEYYDQQEKPRNYLLEDIQKYKNNQ